MIQGTSRIHFKLSLITKLRALHPGPGASTMRPRSVCCLRLAFTFTLCHAICRHPVCHHLPNLLSKRNVYHSLTGAGGARGHFQLHSTYVVIKNNRLHVAHLTM